MLHLSTYQSKSLVSSEGTSASGLAGAEEEHIQTSQTTGDTVDGRLVDITPTCNKLLTLRLSTAKDPFRETLKVLVQETQSSLEADPDIRKDYEDGTWLPILQLVEKQYQLLTALVQTHQKCESSGQPNPVNATLISNDRSLPVDLTSAASHSPLTSPPLHKATETINANVTTEGCAATVMSSDPKYTDSDGSHIPSPLSSLMLTLDPAVHECPSERTSGVTSPSHFIPPFPTQAYGCQKTRITVSPELSHPSLECSTNPGDTDTECSSIISSLSDDALSSATEGEVPSISQDKTQACSFTTNMQGEACAPSASEEEGSHTSNLKLNSTSATGQHLERSSSSGDSLVLSLLRQNLREKHHRHVVDMRANYEAEIQALRDKLNTRDLSLDLEKSNQALRERCEHLERALTEATGHMQELETKNITLEGLYTVRDSTMKSLQQCQEESKGSDKDALVAQLRTRVSQLEEAVQTARREADDKEAMREQEQKMLYDLLEHENQARLHYASHDNTQPSGAAGLLHNTDLLLSPSKCNAKQDVTSLKPPWPLTDQSESGRKSPFPQTSQSNGYRNQFGYSKSQYLQPEQAAGPGGSRDSSGGGSRRCASPPGKPQSQCQPQPRPQEHCGSLPQQRRIDRLCPQAPMMSNPRTRVGVVADTGLSELVRGVVGPEQGVAGGVRRLDGPEWASAGPGSQRSLSSEGHRFSSLAPQTHQQPTATPTKRETPVMPLSERPSANHPPENYATALGQMVVRQKQLHKRSNLPPDQRSHSTAPVPGRESTLHQQTETKTSRSHIYQVSLAVST